MQVIEKVRHCCIRDEAHVTDVYIIRDT